MGAWVVARFDAKMVKVMFNTTLDQLGQATDIPTTPIFLIPGVHVHFGPLKRSQPDLTIKR